MGEKRDVAANFKHGHAVLARKEISNRAPRRGEKRTFIEANKRFEYDL